MLDHAPNHKIGTYKPETFKSRDSYSFKEYVFECVLMLMDIDNKPHSITYLYVSKEYNVAAIGAPYKPGRFIISKGGNITFDHLSLAEQPAISHTDEQEPGFNVELHYLGIRKKRPSGNIMKLILVAKYLSYVAV